MKSPVGIDNKGCMVFWEMLNDFPPTPENKLHSEFESSHQLKVAENPQDKGLVGGVKGGSFKSFVLLLSFFFINIYNK